MKKWLYRPATGIRERCKDMSDSNTAQPSVFKAFFGIGEKDRQINELKTELAAMRKEKEQEAADKKAAESKKEREIFTQNIIDPFVKTLSCGDDNASALKNHMMALLDHYEATNDERNQDKHREELTNFFDKLKLICKIALDTSVSKERHLEELAKLDAENKKLEQTRRLANENLSKEKEKTKKLEADLAEIQKDLDEHKKIVGSLKSEIKNASPNMVEVMLKDYNEYLENGNNGFSEKYNPIPFGVKPNQSHKEIDDTDFNMFEATAGATKQFLVVYLKEKEEYRLKEEEEYCYVIPVGDIKRTARTFWKGFGFYALFESKGESPQNGIVVDSPAVFMRSPKDGKIDVTQGIVSKGRITFAD